MSRLVTFDDVRKVQRWYPSVEGGLYTMNPTLRRLIIIGAPIVLGVLDIFHPSLFTQKGKVNHYVYLII